MQEKKSNTNDKYGKIDNNCFSLSLCLDLKDYHQIKFWTYLQMLFQTLLILGINISEVCETMSFLYFHIYPVFMIETWQKYFVRGDSFEFWIESFIYYKKLLDNKKADTF